MVCALECGRSWVRASVGSNQGLCNWYLLLLTQHYGERANIGWLGSSIMCPNGVTFLPADCCFSKLALKKSNSVCWSRIKWTSSSSHWQLTYSRYNITEIGIKQQSLTHSINQKWILKEEDNFYSRKFHLAKY